jgi:hypothetical protein
MPTRLTVPDEHIAIIMPQQLAEELFSLLAMIRRNRRLHVTPGIKGIAGDVILAGMDTIPQGSLTDRLQKDRIGERKESLK